MVLLTIPDDVIAAVARELAEAGVVPAGHVVAHCSGALPSEVLAPLADAGALTASMHPLQTFPSVLIGVDCLPGTHCFCEGHPRALSVVMQLAGDIGCVPIELAADRKTLYHAAACMACLRAPGARATKPRTASTMPMNAGISAVTLSRPVPR